MLIGMDEWHERVNRGTDEFFMEPIPGKFLSYLIGLVLVADSFQTLD